MGFLAELKGKHNVVGILAGMRLGEQVVLVLPYHEHDDFRVCSSLLPTF